MKVEENEKEKNSSMFDDFKNQNRNNPYDFVEDDDDDEGMTHVDSSSTSTSDNPDNHNVIKPDSNPVENHSVQDSSDNPNNPGFAASTENKSPDMSFSSFDEASKMKGGQKKGKKPPRLNKTQILIIIVATVFLLIGLIIFNPSFSSEKKTSSEKPNANKTIFSDYENMASNGFVDNSGREVSSEQGLPIESEEPQTDTKPEKEPQKVNEKYGGKQDEPDKFKIVDTTYAGTATASGIEIPDTRNDALQGKRIAGIKGITDSQESYATDYEVQKKQNALEAAIIKKTVGNPSSSLTSSAAALSKDEYTRQLMQLQASNSYAQQNNQADKNSFYEKSGGSQTKGNYLGLNTIWQGTIFEVVTTSEINTDLPGEITARVAKNIYSSQDSRYLLIPQNSIVYGRYNSSISYSQSRVQVQWNTIIRPDGFQIDLGGFNGTDAKGASGVKGFVNDHPGAYMKAILLMSVFNVVNSEFQNSIDSSTNNKYAQNVAANAQDVVNQLGEKLIDRAMNVQPTIKIKAGTKLNIVANQSFALPPVEDVPVTQRYRRGYVSKEDF